ncbi:TetR/AcrR family transcriptional regulator [Cupriavidus plantarum]|uniref:TetR family transcriptional regulator n=1 Tax=Cupriavidus plantarum TaxID=942865 RepID=A0A316ET49_9BURK|nr:TetR/AcrR family transcriptional regulator [Cupriavidus plantarum]NYI01751.1 TetR/AcrR family transcriptional repressor of nem operon [Cupriavidus plantarum]PWK33887.1 TetR family transcriptional regulator [Cupriavidus plantarum]REE91064.1 TetR family transcriptional regulator [Cupriavidus plantarum]RLK33737.1 TetR family transcriptional regulator [Cupriavidus plantarum]
MKTTSVRDQLLAHTLVLIQRRGYNGFSYRDLAELVGVKTSSIHYYFPTKDDLVLEAVKLYTASVSDRIQAIDPSLPLPEQAKQFLEPLNATIDLGNACLAGMLSAEVVTMPEPVRALLQAHFQMNEAWLTRLLQRAEEERGCPGAVAPEALAKVIYGAVQNGVITARMSGSNDRFEAACDMLIGAVSSDPSAHHRAPRGEREAVPA